MRTHTILSRFALFGLLGLAAIGAAAPATAQEWHGHWGDRELRHYPGHFDHWRAGHWVHGPYHGREGWWWVVGGTWYFYPAPVYPYPDPYSVPPPVVAGPPPAVVVPVQPGTVVAAPTSQPYTAPNGQTCREYQSTAEIGGHRQMTYGTACLQPDGSWRIVG
jgi:hypothetical protein